MAIMKNGILGTTTGKIGNIVGATWRGKNVVKTYNPTPRNPKTARQTAQRSLFKAIVAYVVTLLQYVKKVNIFTKVNLPAYNIAVSETIKFFTESGLTQNDLNLFTFRPIKSFDFTIFADITTLSETLLKFENFTGIQLSTDFNYFIVAEKQYSNEFTFIDNANITVQNESSITFSLTDFSFTTAEVYTIGLVIIDPINKKTSSFLVIQKQVA